MTKTARRTFLKAATVTSVGYMVAAGNQKAISQSPNERPGVACIGIGGKGDSDSNNAAQFGNIIAICDIDKGRLQGKLKGDRFKDAKSYLDFRELLTKHEKEIEIVTISTPDHMHAPATLMAMNMGKHCYTQKPMTRTIYEARMMSETAQKTGVCTQMGNQGSALPTGRWAIEQLKNGVLGKTKEVWVWSNRPVWPQGPNRVNTIAKFRADAQKSGVTGADLDALVAEQQKTVNKGTENIDWDLWLGVAPKREYWPGIYHSFSWRSWWDFGTGALGDMACHMLTVPFEGVNLRNPVSVKAKTTGHDFDSFPESSIIEFQFAETEKNPAFKFHWYDRNGNKPPQEIFDAWDIKPKNSGVLIIGEKGAFYSSDDYCGHAEFKKVEPSSAVPKNEGNFDVNNMKELFDAVDKKDQRFTKSNFIDRGGPLTETILLGNFAVWAAYKGGGEGKMMEDWG
ncbi:MAG: Gfo/Idh/MocA family oxidoreductase, partial [Planctomycetaceae bacterium]|nr:Gfo/Idh/MocA family oxidoreductase [Planctomycetaceae bacterium]